MTGRCFLIGGPPGSGKTAFTYLMYDPMGFPEQKRDIAVAADDFMVDENGVYCYDKTRLSEVHAKCQAVVKSAMQNGVERVWVHNTFLSREERQPYYDLAKKYKYEAHALWMLNEHGNKSVHGVPEDSMDKMHAKQVKDLTTN